jgi:hypothetical protein
VQARYLLAKKPQFELQTNAAQRVARAVTDQDGMVIAIVEQLARSSERLALGPKGFRPGRVFVAPSPDRDRHAVVIGDQISRSHLCPKAGFNIIQEAESPGVANMRWMPRRTCSRVDRRKL